MDNYWDRRIIRVGELSSEAANYLISSSIKKTRIAEPAVNQIFDSRPFDIFNIRLSLLINRLVVVEYKRLVATIKLRCTDYVFSRRLLAPPGRWECQKHPWSPSLRHLLSLQRAQPHLTLRTHLPRLHYCLCNSIKLLKYKPMTSTNIYYKYYTDTYFVQTKS